MISLIISIIIFLGLDFLNNKIIAMKNSKLNNVLNNEIVSDNLNIKVEDKISMDNKSVWQLEIPKINLIAPIQDGIDEKTLDKYIGHFPTTSDFNGNIGLAAHNRGYQINYFERLKELEFGDIIIYKTENGERKYKVDVITIIDDTDWSYLEETLDNRITLITCVENQPIKRRLVQGVEI